MFHSKLTNNIIPYEEKWFWKNGFGKQNTMSKFQRTGYMSMKMIVVKGLCTVVSISCNIQVISLTFCFSVFEGFVGEVIPNI